MSLMDLLYPRRCHGCHGSVESESLYFCWDCLSEITCVEPPFCSICGDPVPGRIDHEYVCYHCSRKPPHFDRARSAGRYEGLLGDALRDLKYNGAVWLVPDLARILHACVQTHYALLEIDVLCYVPMYSTHQREREYNQAQLLAVALGRLMGKPVRRRGFRRLFMAGSQTGLTASERAANVKNAFACGRGGFNPFFREGRRSAWAGLSCLLIDDVMTTGATVSECARALKADGVRHVYVVTAARG